MSKSSSTNQSHGLGNQAGEPYLFLALDGNQPTGPVSRHRLGNVQVMQIGRGVERVVQRDTHEGKSRLVLRFPDPWMSSLHARIERSDKGMVMSDPTSKNGSFVNGTRLKSAVLTDGDVLQFGHTFFIYREDLPVGRQEDDLIADLDVPLGMATMLAPLAQGLIAFARAATTETPLLIQGQTGTGKSIMARSAHALSGRPGSLITVNVSEVSDAQFEKKLRGHEEGGTGSLGGVPGVIASAKNGTLVIEDVDKLSFRSQALLSRVMSEGWIRPWNDEAPIPWQCRLVCTASSSLDDMVEIGRFDPKLLQQIKGFEQVLPSLCQRREDIGLLIASMITHYAPTGQVMFSADAAYAILSYGWPRNLRELESCLGTALAWRSSTMVEISHLPPELRRPADRGHAASGDTIDTVELVQQDLEKRANMIASLRARSGHLFNNRDSLDQVRNQFKRWLARTDVEFTDK